MRPLFGYTNLDLTFLIAVIDSPGKGEVMVGGLLSTLVELSNLIVRCNAVCVNIVGQLSSLLHDHNNVFLDSDDVTAAPLDAKTKNPNALVNTSLVSVFQCVGDLLRVLLTIDSIVTSNKFLTDSWSRYKSMIAGARRDPGPVGFQEAGILDLEKLLLFVDVTLIRGECRVTRMQVISDANNASHEQ
jgi:hypothetical protein